MDFRLLRLAQMAAIARYLTTTARPTLLAQHGGQTFVDRLEHFLTYILTPDPQRARQIAALDALLRRLDGRHDRLVRIVFYTSLVQAELAEEAGNPAEAEAWRALSLRMLPDGLATNQLSWLEEGDLAVALPQRLEPGDRARLLSVPLAAPHGDLALATDRLVAVGGELSLNEAERAILRAQEKRQSLSHIGEARRLFGSTIKQLDANLDFHSVPVEVRDVLLSKLQEALNSARASTRPTDDEADLAALLATNPA